MPPSDETVQDMLDHLASLETAAPSPPQGMLDAARQWCEAISRTREFLSDRNHPVVFIGSVGVGKSSLIGVVANLLVGEAPKDRPTLKNNSVLAIGSGRTTVCEVHIRSDGSGKVGLRIDPFSEDEMKKEIELFAEAEWRRRQPDFGRADEDEADPTAQEIQRVIRGMTDYNEYQEVIREGKIRKRRTVRPLDEVVPRYSSWEEFAAHLVERAQLHRRKVKEWWWDHDGVDCLRELKERFEGVNQGTESTAMLPRRMTVIVPDPMPGISSSINVSLIDTRGLDGAVETREDLQEFLRDPRALLVFCASFNDAPGDTMRALLRSMAGDVELRLAIPRILMVLLDQGDSDQVNGANGDREFGQELKVEECHLALEGAGLPRMIDKRQIIAFDVLKDDRSFLIESLSDSLDSLRESAEGVLAEQLENAQSFLDGVEDQVRPALRETVDRRIREVMGDHLPADTPLTDPLAGLYEAIHAARYASVVYAACRRRGIYSRLNLYAAVDAEASRAATSWLDELFDNVFSKIGELECDQHLSLVLDHIRLRRAQFAEAQLKVIKRYTELVGGQVRAKLHRDELVWGACCREWGAGPGFKKKVLGHLEAWSARQPGFNAHENTDALSEIPFIGEISRPAQAPRFTLHVTNLRALHQVSWSPEQLSVLIGANGVGKTTLLLTLKLLRVAYERGLPSAVADILGGSSNLRSWHAKEGEPLEIGLDVGDASWRVRLVAREGSVEHVTSERLVEKGREIFSRDSLGVFTYGEERIGSSEQLGLRTLIDRGAHEPALRTMARFLQRVSIYYDPDLHALRKGSNTSENRYLNSRGTNALAVLRRWYQEKSNHHRYQFVIEGLKAAFPHNFSDLDFLEAGTTITAQIYRPGRDLPSPIANEANGFIQLLILFCEVAAADDESLVAIDEPENSLHPYAVRIFLKRANRWAKKHNVTILLATHSTVLLDDLSANPEQVYVMKPGGEEGTIPSRLDDLYDVSWLSQYKLGDLYEEDEIGSNLDADK